MLRKKSKLVFIFLADRFVPLVDMSIPMEELTTATDRYNRILTLENKPYQLGSTEISKYFKA